jgi:hypothetical protein
MTVAFLDEMVTGIVDVLFAHGAVAGVSEAS